MVRDKKEIGRWRTIDTEYISQRPWLTARRDCVELPDGRVNNEFYVIEYPDWVNVIARTREGLFVMIRQYRHGLGQVLTELCAGVMEQGETPEQAARRELAEETGYSGGRWTLLNVISANPSTTNNLTYCFLAEDVELTDGQHLDANEDIAVDLLSRDELYALLCADGMKQALMAAPLWHYFATHA